ncbi:MAG: hypothetical protein RIT81_44855 [Deltaproteobacteria bacterium]
MTESEGRALVDAWRKSGLTQSEFARRRGVKVQRVQYWSRRLGIGREEAANKPADFVVVTAGERELPPDDGVFIELVVDDRFFVSVPSTAENISVLVRAMVEAGR